MQLRADIQIKSMIKATIEVILPAIDPANELATQQAQLVLGHLTLLEQRLPLQYRADCDELRRLIDLSKDLTERHGVVDDTLSVAIPRAQEVLERARAEPDELVSAIRQLTAALDQPIQDVIEKGSNDVRLNVQKAVLDSAEQQLLRNRAWLIMQGWEPDPGSLPEITTLFEAS